MDDIMETRKLLMGISFVLVFFGSIWYLNKGKQMKL